MKRTAVNSKKGTATSGRRSAVLPASEAAPALEILPESRADYFERVCLRQAKIARQREARPARPKV